MLVNVCPKRAFGIKSLKILTKRLKKKEKNTKLLIETWNPIKFDCDWFDHIFDTFDLNLLHKKCSEMKFRNAVSWRPTCDTFDFGSLRKSCDRCEIINILFEETFDRMNKPTIEKKKNSIYVNFRFVRHFRCVRDAHYYLLTRALQHKDNGHMNLEHIIIWFDV